MDFLLYALAGLLLIDLLHWFTEPPWHQTWNLAFRIALGSLASVLSLMCFMRVDPFGTLMFGAVGVLALTRTIRMRPNPKD